MPRRKLTILKITPETHVRATKGDAIFFRIPEADLLPAGLERKRRLVKYNDYKKQLLQVFKQANFEMPESRGDITFFLPVSKSWSAKKKRDHHGQPHRNKPDADNLLKAMKDATMHQDSIVWNVEITKLWTNSEKGWIEVFIKSPIKLSIPKVPW
jgi:Holliday junction resolvase RusA-like endonuclease